MTARADAPIVHDVQQARAAFAQMTRTGRLRGRFRLPPEMAIFTAHNYPRKSLLEQNLDHLGIDGYTVLNKPVPTWSNSIRVLWFLDYLTGGRCKSPFVLYCDADDVVLRDDPRRVLDAFLELDCDLLFCSTRWPHGYKCMPEVKRWADATHRGRYLNGGVCVGRRECMVELYRRVAEYVTPDDSQDNPDSAAFYRDEARFRQGFPRGVGCDQAILRYLEPQFHPRLQIDAESRVFWRNSNVTACQRVARQLKRCVPQSLKKVVKHASSLGRGR